MALQDRAIVVYFQKVAQLIVFPGGSIILYCTD